jgi:hypothetical protein
LQGPVENKKLQVPGAPRNQWERGVRDPFALANLPERRRHAPSHENRKQEPDQRRHQHERAQLQVPRHLSDSDRDGGTPLEIGQSGQAEPRRPGRKRAPIQDRRHRRQIQRSDQDQQSSVVVGQRDLRLGRELAAHSVQGLEADQAAAGLAGRQQQDDHDREHRSGERQLRRNDHHAEVRLQGQIDQEPADQERGHQRRQAAGPPGGNRQAEGADRDEGERGGVRGGVRGERHLGRRRRQQEGREQEEAGAGEDGGGRAGPKAADVGEADGARRQEHRGQRQRERGQAGAAEDGGGGEEGKYEEKKKKRKSIQGATESCTDILTTSYWLHVELGKNIEKILCQKIK